MSEPWYEASAEKYLTELEQDLASGTIGPRRLETLFGNFLSVAGAPTPDPSTYQLFLEPEVLRALAHELSFPFAKDLREQINRIDPYRSQGESTFFRVRGLSILGLYPNLDVTSGPASYLVRQGTPFLITKNSGRQEGAWSYGSELSDWTRHETRLATALSCTEWGGFSLYLGRHARDFSLDLLRHVPNDKRLDFMLAYDRLSEHIHRHHRYGYWRGASEVVGRYEFGDFRAYRKSSRRFASKFLVSHPLLLRTGRHYLKSSMLWRTDGFTEDALASLFFALEGCLLLFQEMADGRTDRIDRRLLKQTFAATYDSGEELYDFIEEAMGWGGTRARIIHPQLAASEGWTPFLMADDYYDYDKTVRALLTYLVTEGTFEDYDLAP